MGVAVAVGVSVAVGVGVIVGVEVAVGVGVVVGVEGATARVRPYDSPPFFCCEGASPPCICCRAVVMGRGCPLGLSG